jgi:hypothetical protein
MTTLSISGWQRCQFERCRLHKDDAAALRASVRRSIVAAMPMVTIDR